MQNFTSISLSNQWGGAQQPESCKLTTDIEILSACSVMIKEVILIVNFILSYYQNTAANETETAKL